VQAPDGDTVQDTTTPDAPGTQVPETPGAESAKPAAGAAKAASETEKPAAEEPGDMNLPGGGHADPAGQNVDHQFDGVE
jgi:hypothetical protein